MTLRPCSLLFLAAMTLTASRAGAVELGTEGEIASVEVHAFASQGFILSSHNNYLDTDTTHGSFQFSEVGINFTKTLVDRLRLGLQVYAGDLGPTGTFDAKLDWFYLDYRFADWLGVRAGRVKIPFGLYNESQDIDSARTFVLLPQSLYPVENVNYLLAQTGGDVYGYLKIGGAGALDYRAYAGTIFLNTTDGATSPGYQILSFNVPFLVGGRLLWETPLDGLRLGGSVQTLRIDTQILAGATPVTLEIPATLAVGSIEYAAHDLLLAAEYSRWFLSANSSNAAVIPQSPQMVSERAYALVSYRVSRWLQPGAYYSLLFPNVDDRSGRANVQHDIATTLRFDMNTHWLLKLEGHYMLGTAGLDTSLNDNLPLTGLSKSWGVFLVKTTAYF